MWDCRVHSGWVFPVKVCIGFLVVCGSNLYGLNLCTHWGVDVAPIAVGNSFGEGKAVSCFALFRLARLFGQFLVRGCIGFICMCVHLCVVRASLA